MFLSTVPVLLHHSQELVVFLFSLRGTKIESVLFVTTITARIEEIAQGMRSRDREEELWPNSGVYLSTTSRLFMRQG